jgi:amino acid permease
MADTTTRTDPLLLVPPSNPRTNTAATSVRTYVVGEDAGRLASAAQFLGLTFTEASSGDSPRRKPKRPVREAGANVFWNDSTLTAARMHSVGAIGSNEVVDSSGTLHLHYISRRRRRTTAAAVPQQRVPSYGTLTDLFQKEDKQEQQKAIDEAGRGVAEGDEEESEEEEEIIEVVDMVEGGSLKAAIFGIVKGTVGPAILYLPRGFELSGYAIAIPAMLFATAMYIYNAHLLLQCWKVESDKNHKIAQRMQEVRALLEESAPANTGITITNGHSSSAPTANVIPQFTPKLLTYPELARRALGPFAILVEFGIASMQFGVCLTYLIFVPQNLHECLYGMTGRFIPKIYFLVFMVLVEIPLSWIRDIRKLTPTNVVATMLIAYGLFSVLVIAMMTGFARAHTADGGAAGFVFQQNLRALPAVTDTWFIFIGTSFFMMEGSITLLVPLQEAVYTADDKAKFPRVNQVVTSWIVVFYICFSMICVAAFGSNIHTALTASLKGSLATTVQLAYSIAVIFTFPLQAFPALEVAMKALLPGSSSSISISSSSSLKNKEQQEKDNNVKIFRRNALATFLTCLLGVIAVIAIDYLGNVVSILGSLFGIPLALVFPPLMHNNLVLNSSRNNSNINATDRSATLSSSSSLWGRISSSTTFIRYTNYCVVVAGFFAMGAASFATIVSWDKGAEGG